MNSIVIDISEEMDDDNRESVTDYDLQTKNVTCNISDKQNKQYNKKYKNFTVEELKNELDTLYNIDTIVSCDPGIVNFAVCAYNIKKKEIKLLIDVSIKDAIKKKQKEKKRINTTNNKDLITEIVCDTFSAVVVNPERTAVIVEQQMFLREDAVRTAIISFCQTLKVAKFISIHPSIIKNNYCEYFPKCNKNKQHDSNKKGALRMYRDTIGPVYHTKNTFVYNPLRSTETTRRKNKQSIAFKKEYPVEVTHNQADAAIYAIHYSTDLTMEQLFLEKSIFGVGTHTVALSNNNFNQPLSKKRKIEKCIDDSELDSEQSFNQINLQQKYRVIKKKIKIKK